MVVRFFGKTEHIATVPLEQYRIANSDWYKTICFPWNQENQPSKTYPFSPRQCKHSHICSNKSIFEHAKSSPDLALNNFFLFSYLKSKNKLRVQRFSTPEETVSAFRIHVLEIPQSKWFKRMQEYGIGIILENNKVIFDD